MEQIILDSDILIDHLRRYPPAGRYLEELKQQYSLALSVFTVFEIQVGTRPHQEEALNVLLQGFDLLATTPAIARQAGRYYQLHQASGMDEGDAIIAATAVHHHARLISGNAKHYPMQDLSLTVPPYRLK